MIEFRPDQTRYEQVAVILEERIKKGTYQPGQPIPSVTQMQQEFGIAKNTVYKTIALLQRRDLIYTVPNLGSFVMTEEELAKRRAEKDAAK
ncbi:GntR family transcriptional regulator [Nonomuraea sp. SYSU D8015]|uniref:GntR family transcriptional regulator n=1 Tax=Nonomuraea sp. SYSU D8015 TaxID=2593644 RepID=UPI0016617020|nr:winged helix-turn-helix domain-containing protein [Nonomuraea sp. SYSU D8015]